MGKQRVLVRVPEMILPMAAVRCYAAYVAVGGRDAAGRLFWTKEPAAGAMLLVQVPSSWASGVIFEDGQHIPAPKGIKTGCKAIKKSQYGCPSAHALSA